MVRNYSKFASEAASSPAPPFPAEFKVPRPNLKPTSPSSRSKGATLSDGGDGGDRAAFEAELANGRSKLKKVRRRRRFQCHKATFCFTTTTMTDTIFEVLGGASGQQQYYVDVNLWYCVHAQAGLEVGTSSRAGPAFESMTSSSTKDCCGPDGHASIE